MANLSPHTDTNTILLFAKLSELCKECFLHFAHDVLPSDSFTFLTKVKYC